MHFIGDGISKEKYKRETRFLGDKVQFYGFLNSGDVHLLLKRAHFILLPSTASEGFPKVIAEAACYGVIPIVSNVGSIGHYIDIANGFIWDSNSDTSYEEVLSKALNSGASVLKDKSIAVVALAEKFTFANYKFSLNKILTENPD
ncbi:Glycosyl transferases group 1 [compost metagenome]